MRCMLYIKPETRSCEFDLKSLVLRLVKSVRSIMDVSGFSSIQLERFLIDKGFGEKVARENEIDGAVFCERTAEGGCPEDK